VLIASAGVLLVAGAGAGGWAIGQREATSADDAAKERREARRTAEEDAYRRSFRTSKKRGLQDGRAEGRRSGRRHGTAAAQREIDAQRRSQEEQDAAKQSACPPGQQLLTHLRTALLAKSPSALKVPARQENDPR
jgi:hypothetical protein